MSYADDADTEHVSDEHGYEWKLSISRERRALSRILSRVPRPDIHDGMFLPDVILGILDYTERIALEAEAALNEAERLNEETRAIAGQAVLGKRKIKIGG